GRSRGGARTGLEGRAQSATIEPFSMSMPHVNAMLPEAGIVRSTATGLLSGRSRRSSRAGETSWLAQPTSDVSVRAGGTGTPGGEDGRLAAAVVGRARDDEAHGPAGRGVDRRRVVTRAVHGHGEDGGARGGLGGAAPPLATAGGEGQAKQTEEDGGFHEECP